MIKKIVSNSEIDFKVNLVESKLIFDLILSGNFFESSLSLVLMSFEIFIELAPGNL